MKRRIFNRIKHSENASRARFYNIMENKMKFFKHFGIVFTNFVLITSSMVFGGYEPFYGPDSLWETIQSTSNGFVVIDAIDIFDESVVSGFEDATPSGACGCKFGCIEYGKTKFSSSSF